MPRSTADLLGEYGLQEVPEHLTREVGCQICRYATEEEARKDRSKLWTQEPLKEPTTAVAYSAWVNRIRTNTYCTFHAKWYFIEGFSKNERNKKSN